MYTSIGQALSGTLPGLNAPNAFLFCEGNTLQYGAIPGYPGESLARRTAGLPSSFPSSPLGFRSLVPKSYCADVGTSFQTLSTTGMHKSKCPPAAAIPRELST